MNVSARHPAPLARSTWLLVRLRLRRLVNLLSAAGQQKKKKLGDGRRTGNPGKKSCMVVMFVAWPIMLLMFHALAAGAVDSLHQALDPPTLFWRSVEFSTALARGAAYLLALWWAATVVLTISSGELAKPEWDLEWLITLPVRSETLIWARVLERSLVNPSGFLALAPACTVIAWFSGYRWLAPLVGVLASWPLLVLAALVRTLVDTGLRLRMRASQLRNLHAVLSVAAVGGMYLAMSLGMKGKSAFMVSFAGEMPGWLMHTPFGLAVTALNERAPAEAIMAWLALFAEVAVLTWLGVLLLRHQLRNGVLSGGARDTARSPAKPPSPVGTDAPGPAATPFPASAVQRRELTLLRRDRNFLVQSAVVPLLIVGGQLVLGTSGVATSMWTNPDVLASVAFGLAAYSLSMSAFQTLNTEGHALWLLYTLPCSIEHVLRDKARLWAVLTLVYPVVLFGIGMFTMPVLEWKFFAAMATALIGIPIYAHVAVALGVFGSNPLEQHQAQKVKPAYVYLYMSLAALYVYAVVTPNAYQRVVFIVLTLLLAFALWQKARDRLPYLLDPDVAPPGRVSLSDGLIAAMFFFVVQGIVMVILMRVTRAAGASLVIAFTIAGALTYALMRAVYAHAKTAGVPRLLGDANGPLPPVAAGLAAAAAGVAYLLAARGSGLLDEALRGSYDVQLLGWWLLPLALVAAPLFEEFIFRGLVYGGLRRSFGFWPAALASAAIFAILHPPVSVPPVFVLGLATAWSYERSRGLLAPMITHAVYNAGVLVAQAALL
jgi:ABC-2 type transport system permease protein